MCPSQKGMPNHGLGGHLNQLHRFNADMLTYPRRALETSLACHLHVITTNQPLHHAQTANFMRLGSQQTGEPGRCVGLVSWLSNASDANAKWTTASPQLNIPDRCQCCTALQVDRSTGTLYHFSAVSSALDYKGNIMTIVRSSMDCGLTWTAPRPMWPNHAYEHQIVVTIVEDEDTGEILIPCDLWADKLPRTEKGDQSVAQHNPDGWSAVGRTLLGVSQNQEKTIELTTRTQGRTMQALCS